MRILLFDIDGTLIRSGGAGKHAMEAGLRSAFGVREVRDRVQYSGRTDPGISHDLLVAHDIEPNDLNIDRLRQEYLTHLPQALHRCPGTVLPGIQEMIEKPHPSWVMGLMSGNVAAGAEIKLRHYGLWDYFSVGIFADGLKHRDELARRGLSILENQLNRTIEPSTIWVIGDTPADVQCARAIGAQAVAVATGWHSEEELRASNPDWFLPDFTQAAGLLSTWGYTG